MNWLAHLRLAPTDPLVRLGNLAGDFVAGVDLTTLPQPLQVGIAQHRAIDRFVDRHPVFLRSRARLAPAFQRFGGVLVDVFCDHFLARAWERLGDGRPLPEFTSEAYAALREHADLLPPRLRQVSPWMERQDWLGSYADVAGVDLTLARMQNRLSRPTVLGHGGEQLRAHYAALADDFAELWADLVRFVGASAG